jgi:hypothetical protein
LRQCGFRSRRRIHRGAGLQLLALPQAGRVIRHHFCANCGIAPFGEGVGPDGAAMASINLRCIPAVDLGALTVKAYDGAAR